MSAQNINGARISGNMNINVLSATTLYSGSTPLTTIISNIGGGGGATTLIQNGRNIVTGGTSAAPTVNLVTSPSVNNIAISGTASIAGSITSGSTNIELYSIWDSYCKPLYIQQNINKVEKTTAERSILDNQQQIDLISNFWHTGKQLRLNIQGLISTAQLGRVADINFKISLNDVPICTASITNLTENMVDEYFSAYCTITYLSGSSVLLPIGAFIFPNIDNNSGLNIGLLRYGINTAASTTTINPVDDLRLDTKIQLSDADPGNIFKVLDCAFDYIN